MKYIYVFIVVTLAMQTGVAQKNDLVQLIDLDSSWGQEIFPFPIRFAPSINYVGVADVRFPPDGWLKPDHEFFWSYTYAWDVNLKGKLTSQELNINLERYFDGLNSVNETDHLDQKAKATIHQIKEEQEVIYFSGTIDTYDHFATNDRIILHVKIQSYFCATQQKTIILFKFSPKEFTHSVWNTLNEIKLKSGLCE